MNKRNNCGSTGYLKKGSWGLTDKALADLSNDWSRSKSGLKVSKREIKTDTHNFQILVTREDLTCTEFEFIELVSLAGLGKPKWYFQKHLTVLSVKVT